MCFEKRNGQRRREKLRLSISSIATREPAPFLIHRVIGKLKIVDLSAIVHKVCRIRRKGENIVKINGKHGGGFCGFSYI
jgi:hypothetical protein